MKIFVVQGAPPLSTTTVANRKETLFYLDTYG
jgi:hypothetical protein